MLEKNKDYLEMSVSSTECAFTQNATMTISIEGFSYDTSFRLPNPGESYVIVSKEKFEALKAENEQLKKKLEEFSPCPGYKEFLTALYPETSDADIEKLVWTTEQLCCGRDLRHALQVDLTYHQALSSVRARVIDSLKQNYETLSKLVGFSSVEEIEDYLVNEAECDTLHDAIYLMYKEMDRRKKQINELRNEVKCISDKWASANSSNNSWKAAAECNSPKELIEKLSLLRDDISGRRTVIEHYKRDIEKWQKATGCLSPDDIFTSSLISKTIALEQEINIRDKTLQEWREGTNCPSPSVAKSLIESGASWHHAYGDVKKANEKLADDVKSWKNVTGYATPEDYLAARISGVFHTPFDYTAAWQKATGCKTPDDVEIRIKALNERIDASEAVYNHLLMLTGFESEGEIEDALDKCDHSTLRKALVDYEFNYENLLKLTGYKTEQDIRVLLNDSEQFVYETMRELINSLKRKAEFTESNWQAATGCDTPGGAEEKLEFYKEHLDKVVQAASCATKHLESIMS